MLVDERFSCSQDEDRKFEDALVLGASRKRDASRRMAAKAVQVAILRDAREERAPQDEGGARLDMISFKESLSWLGRNLPDQSALPSAIMGRIT